MALPPARIRSIDVVEDVYVKGDLRFGGIINLHSVNGDMAGIDLPPHSFFIDFMALDKSAAAEEVNSSSGDRLPDTRNTLLWLPEFELGKDQATDLSFEAPDYPGEYVVLFRGSNSRGELISVETRFEVK
jgi:hypothetical protein